MFQQLSSDMKVANTLSSVEIYHLTHRGSRATCPRAFRVTRRFSHLHLQPLLHMSRFLRFNGDDRHTFIHMAASEAYVCEWCV